ncbi:hypothetical protein FRB96_003416 [Tulasnella sp. 330]|nr:hypothetical protein FRB96_003416 [Tulasnella sp. 330]
MSEPLRQPQPPHALGMDGKGSVKRKLDRNSDGSGGEEDEGSGAKRRKEDGTSKKKSRNANNIPKGFQIKKLAVPGSSQGRHRSPSASQDPSQPSTSYTIQSSQPLSPPPNRHPIPPPNPDDRPLPKPKSIPLAPSSSQPTHLRPGHPSKPPSSNGHKPIKPSFQRGNSVQLPFSIKGKERAHGPNIDDVGTPEELERLQQLHGEINSIDDGRQESRRKAGTPNPSNPISLTQTSNTRITPVPIYNKTSDPLQTPNSRRPPPPSGPVLNGSTSEDSSGSRHGLHSSISSVPVPLDDTPMIQKNRELRHEQTVRRKSSIGLRSVRVSESFGAGILANPHPSVEFANFYTHISPDLPEALRIRQLLVWCSSRAQVTSGAAPTAGPSSQPTNSSPALPVLSSAQEALLRDIQDDFMKSLCLGKVDTSLPVTEGTPGKRRKKIKEHPRNIINRAQEAEFLRQEKAYKAEDDAWSETLQALNNKQANVFTSLQSRTERRKALEEEFNTRWEAERLRRKGKGRADDDPLPDEDKADDDPEAEKEARLLSSMWDVPTDVFRGDDGVAFAESARLVEEERRLKTRKGGLDEREEALNHRMRALEGLVDEIHQGAHTATVFAKHIDSHLTTFTQALASRFNARIPLPSLSELPKPPLTPGSATTNPITASALVTAMQPRSVLSTAKIPDPMAKFSILSTAKVAEAESDAAKKAAMDAEMGVAERRITAIPATPSTRRTPRKSIGKK